MLTGTLKADWIQLPLESYLAMFPTLKQGVTAGVFKIKGASPWAITRAEKTQVSVFLPNEQSVDDWYTAVYALPTVWPDVSMMGINNLRGGWLRLSPHAEEVRGTWPHTLFARVGGFCSSTLRQLGRDGIRWRKGRRGSLPTGPINLGMI